jgi:4-hydroxythreonine-4-phosphate dehydrogenase
VVGISLGDPSGIGPEVTARALAHPAVRRSLLPVVFGDGPTLERFAVFRKFQRVEAARLGARPAHPTVVEVTRLPERDRRPGLPSRAGGRAQHAYVQALVEAGRAGLVDALCTAPVNKGNITRAGIPFMGHTELLAEAFGVEVLMVMDGPRVRVALATNHVPLADVPRRLTVDGLCAQLKLLHRSLGALLGRAPRLAVCGLNPHAGEGGALGTEEQTVLLPAVRRARRAGVQVEGPFAADGLFARAGRLPYDGVLALYHDQGLVAAKALDFERTVNVTLGLPVPRTSPDHGTAYDLAGTGKASARPMVEALLKAAAWGKASSCAPPGPLA